MNFRAIIVTASSAFIVHTAKPVRRRIGSGEAKGIGLQMPGQIKARRSFLLVRRK
jgi:hypothetical protein